MSSGTSATDTAAGQLNKVLHEGDLASWTLAAIAITLTGRDGAVPDGARQAAALAVLEASGIDAAALDADAALDAGTRQSRAAQASGSLFKAAGVASGQAASWADQSDETLLAQGRASALGGAVMARMLPMLPGLTELLAQPGAALLDVGTGVGALAVACAEALPGVRVVGIDVLPRAVALANKTVADSGVADRVEVRLQDVRDLTEVDRYAAAWVPAPFIPEAVLPTGVKRVAQALVPGGWLCLGYGHLTGSPLEQAVTRFQTACYGGTALDSSQASDLLRDAGLTDMMSPPTQPGLSAATMARRPA